MGEKPLPAGFVPDGFVADTATPAKPAKTWTQTAEDFLPSIGGTIGAMSGGVLGSALGGAAGQGYKDLAQHISELPAALRDIAVNTEAGYGGATARGFVQGAGQGALQAGGQAALQGAATGIGNAISVGAAKVAPALMQSALKPGLRATLGAIKSGDTPPVVQTLLKEGVNVTPGGIEKLNGIIGASNDAIKSALDALPSGTAINPLKVTSRLSDTAAKFANQVNPQADLAAISDVGQNFLAAHGANDLTPQAAQALKVGTYAALKDKAYGQIGSAQIEGEKALARGLKEELANEAAKNGVDLNALNAQEGAAITARDAIAKRVAQVGNRDPAGLAWLAHSPVTFLMAISERSPVVKSLIARGLYQSAAQASGVPAEAIRYAVGAVSASQDQPQQEPQ